MPADTPPEPPATGDARVDRAIWLLTSQIAELTLEVGSLRSRVAALESGAVAEPGAPARPGAEELWRVEDVARFLGVRSGTVSSYRRRGQMPPPDVTLGRTPAWRPETIRSWHAQRPRPGVGGRPR